MKLWLLLPHDVNSSPWKPWYDKAFGFVVRAEIAAEARDLAHEQGGDENRASVTPWLDSTYSSCEPLEASGNVEVIMCDFQSA